MSEEKGLSSYISEERAQNPSLISEEAFFPSLIRAKFLVLALHEGPKLVSSGFVPKCSATLASVATPPPTARQGLGGPNHARHPSGCWA